MIDLLIKNGKVVFPDSTINTSIAVDNGTIMGVGSPATMPEAERVIDANEKFVFPGLIDPHVHFCTPFMGVVSVDTWETGTMAAASGGVTTVIDFAIQKKGSLPMDAIKDRREEADGNVVIDYSVHSCITDPTPETIGQLKEVIEYGIPSFKVFMVYRKEGWIVDDGALLAIFEEVKPYKGLVGLHAENVAILEYLVDKALREGNTSPIYHALTRPPISESEAINRAMYLANSIEAPFYCFHMSLKEGVEMFRQARSEGHPVYAETCTHYLTITKDMLKRPEDGRNFICSPPLRDQEDIEALWKALADGIVSTVATDQAAFTAEHKKLGQDSFHKVPNGLPGIEFRLPLLFSEGVSKGRISVNTLAAVTSTNVAKIFGVYPKKGAINIGSDADLVILDPKLEKTISVADSIYGIDWYPYEGMKVKGNPVITISKGKVVYEDNEFTGKAGDGEFLKRNISSEMLSKPSA
ncbi:MAG: dihydropyrimidinase [Candidatus Heimdallarchaeota archaeon]